MPGFLRLFGGEVIEFWIELCLFQVCWLERSYTVLAVCLLFHLYVVACS